MQDFVKLTDKMHLTIHANPDAEAVVSFARYKEKSDVSRLHKNLDDLMLQMQQLNTPTPAAPGRSF